METFRLTDEICRGMVDSIDIGIALISPDMQILALNTKMRQWFPYIDVAKKPICYRTFNNPPRDSICSYCPTCLTLKDGLVHEAITQTPVGGRIVNYRIVSSPLKDANGNITAAVEMVEDISERIRKDSETNLYKQNLEKLLGDRTRALQESEKKFRLAFENALDTILWADPETGIIINCNKAAEKLFEKSKDELIGRHQTTLHPTNEKERYSEMFKNQILNKMGVDEATIVTKSGKIKIVLISCSMTEIENKRVMQGVFHDITQRKEMENACRVSEESYHSIFESANDGIIIRDIKTYHIINVNSKACEIFCYPKEEMIGLNLEPFYISFGQYTAEKCRQFYEQAASGIPQIFEWFTKDKFGREFWVEVNAKRAIIGGRYCLLSIVRDITERKQAITAKEDFMNMVSHELRTPLSAIKEAFSLVTESRTGIIDTEKKDILDIAKRNIDRLTRLINQVLDFQKLDAGMMKLKFEENNINDIIREVHLAMLSLVSKNRLKFNLKLENKLPRANFDKDKIIEVLNNLISNAVKYTKRGSITIASIKGDNSIQVSVTDTGCGIKEDDMPKLFKRFSQVERKVGGSGLGLAISKEIIEIHKGKIWAESEFGKGTTVHFVLPITERRR
ncbi:MAG: PAS domain-containing sensor histidine kinase [Candidatus Omnitrophota bacterium]|nr:PAS domain-containing sensor histidine kinase [Candidatus Omnitrophota bacterium]